MADVFSPEERSRVMSKIRSSKNKSTELRLQNFFKRNNITGWRKNFPLFGRPDFVFPKLRIAVFVDGCFWHGHSCKNLRPKSNQAYWDKKIERNISRDALVSKVLRSKNWIVMRIWECELKKGVPASKISKLRSA